MSQFAAKVKIPRIDRPVGTPMRVRIAPQDVPLALTKPEHTSFQDIFFGKISSLDRNTRGLFDVVPDIGCPLLSTITPAVRLKLDMEPGKKVLVLVKSDSVSLGNG